MRKQIAAMLISIVVASGQTIVQPTDVHDFKAHVFDRLTGHPAPPGTKVFCGPRADPGGAGHPRPTHPVPPPAGSVSPSSGFTDAGGDFLFTYFAPDFSSAISV